MVHKTILPIFHTWVPHVPQSRVQALKVIEEAAEAYAAAQEYDASQGKGRKMDEARAHLMDELVDVIVSASNTMRAIGAQDVEIVAAFNRVDEHNRERGRWHD